MSPSAMTTAGCEKIMHLPASPSSGHIAMNLPGKVKGKRSLGGNRKKAGWNNRFLPEILPL